MSLKALAESLERKEILIPRLKRFLAEEEAQLASGALEDKEIVMEDARLTIRSFKERLKEYRNRGNLPGKYFHPSALGTCLRKVWFGAMKAPPNEDKLGDNLLREYLVFEMGTYIHVLIQNLCERAGVLLEREIALINPKSMTIGHADGIIRIKKRRYLLEIKTVNPRRFSALRAPDEGYVKQVHAYMKELGLDCTIILYFEKDRAQLKEYIIPFDEGYYKQHVYRRIRYYFKTVENRIVPKREGDHPRQFPCSFCEFSRICYDTQALNKWMLKTGAVFPPKDETKKERLWQKD